jgi:hypothetical protein
MRFHPILLASGSLPLLPALASQSRQRGHIDASQQVKGLLRIPQLLTLIFSPFLSRRAGTEGCVSPDPANTLTDRMNIALNSSGPDFVLRLCPGTRYMIEAPILFAAPNQEISTAGYPTDDTRATLVVDGPVADGTGHTTAVDGTCANCSGVKLRNIQVTNIIPKMSILIHFPFL